MQGERCSLYNYHVCEQFHKDTKIVQVYEK